MQKAVYEYLTRVTRNTTCKGTFCRGYIFDFRIYFNVLRARARVMCEGRSCEASLGTTRLRVYGGVDVSALSYFGH